MITEKKQNGACRPEIEIACDRNNLFVKFKRLDLHFWGLPIKERMSDTDR